LGQRQVVLEAATPDTGDAGGGLRKLSRADQPQYQAALLEMKSATAALAHAERGPARRALGVHPAVTDYTEVVICGKK
ncbi:MAG: hypothetical protein VCE12_07645, partial [Candidatus Latescibacterota bacterium]